MIIEIIIIISVIIFFSEHYKDLHLNINNNLSILNVSINATIYARIINLYFLMYNQVLNELCNLIID